MRIFKLSTLKMLIVLAVIAPCMLPVTLKAQAETTLPKGVKQVWTAIEGNIKYYVKSGDKVKKGDPLFFILGNDNNPALIFQIDHKVNYFRILYLRRKKLVKTQAVSQEEVDGALHNYMDAKDELTGFICKVRLGYYTAPFDCEVTKLLYLNGSGIGDGSPAINIKCTDKDYQFIPPKPNKHFLEIIKRSTELVKSEAKNLNYDKITL